MTPPSSTQAYRAANTVCRVYDNALSCFESMPEEAEGGQEEGCPDEEMSRVVPYENGGAFDRAGVSRS